ncbi:hypothetical protein [Streptomyces sp. NBC_00887]|uniref:hypothetical protein n=1 Tax=Streptomyces sp. NBC_00887 TaxID=2975859 RepID=UPI00386F721F|nr:hypothetical protein OG844_00450 [Streptomyces sp. NBC_00887]WSY36895.1 hypothetical protein OG844_45145 [Streptomyces sp. NBC_00887]
MDHLPRRVLVGLDQLRDHRDPVSAGGRQQHPRRPGGAARLRGLCALSDDLLESCGLFADNVLLVSELRLEAGHAQRHRLSAVVIDPTDSVRDQAIAKTLSTTLTWKVLA